MRGGDLSNEIGPSMGIRFEGVVKTGEGKLNRACKSYLQSLSRRIDVNVFIVTTGDRRLALAFLTKWAVPYNGVIEASELEIPDVVREHDMLYYFDLDKNILQNVNSRGSGKVRVELWESILVS